MNSQTQSIPAPTDSLVAQLMDSISQLAAAQNDLRKAVSVSEAMSMLGIRDRKAFMHLARENNPLRLRKVGNRFIVSVRSIDEYLGDGRT
jgi:hypothetical protein